MCDGVGLTAVSEACAVPLWNTWGSSSWPSTSSPLLADTTAKCHPCFSLLPWTVCSCCEEEMTGFICSEQWHGMALLAMVVVLSSM